MAKIRARKRAPAKSPAQIEATKRNFTIFRLEGQATVLHDLAQEFPEVAAQLFGARDLIDSALITLRHRR